ncbi:MAG TPA: hypothetical protein PLN56_08670 [Methanoregulaceae archaeon]|nr:hypothetical protein [Methanoregulaceae archaeon]
MKQHFAGKLLGIVLLLSVLALFPSVADSMATAPMLPHAFHGSIVAGDSPVSPGLTIEATGPGVKSGISGNPIVTGNGAYGTPEAMGEKLLVQGDVEIGTPLEFYVGGAKAEVYPVSTNGPWLEAYPYVPGDVTELNLRIASQPSAGVTREPTPVQTRIPYGQVPAIAGYSGPALPTPPIVTTYLPGQPPAVTTQAVPGQEGQVQPPGTPAPGGQESGESQGLPPPTKSAGLLSCTAIGALLVIIGAAAYYRDRWNPEDRDRQQ